MIVMIKKCENCSKDFEHPAGSNHPGRFCSRDCLYEFMRAGEYRTCENCHQSFYAKRKGGATRFCSHTCYAVSLVGKPSKGADKLKGRPAWNKGRRMPEYAEANSPRWKGGKVGYTALHQWVYRKLGRPNTCEHCGFTSDEPRKLQWSNISRQYKRDLSDWQRLCQSCHGKYDRKMKRQVDATGY